MRKFIPILKNTKLFAGVTEEEIGAMLSCLGAQLCEYKKGEYVLHGGERSTRITVLVSGELHIQRDDYWGNRAIVNRIAAGEMFGEAYISPDSGVLLHDVIAIEDSAVIFFDVRKTLTVCSSSCRFHARVVQNLFFAVADRNRMLLQKLEHISKRTTREKLISYLSEEAKQHNASSFDIPFNRQQLADFLSVDRSAMSSELCKMRDEGLLEFEKNHFRLL